ncbi:hypothetical protein QP162_07645 [Sphingomonas aurantiaca]
MKTTTRGRIVHQPLHPDAATERAVDESEGDRSRRVQRARRGCFSGVVREGARHGAACFILG